MKQNILENIIFLIKKRIYEEVPTNSTSSTTGAPGFSGSAVAGGPVAGFDQPIDFRRNKYKRLPQEYKKFIKRNKSSG